MVWYFVKVFFLVQQLIMMALGTATHPPTFNNAIPLCFGAQSMLFTVYDSFRVCDFGEELSAWRSE